MAQRDSRGRDGRPRHLYLSALFRQRQLSCSLTVVALLALGAVARHMTVTAASVAGLTSSTAATASATISTAVASTSAEATSTLSAVASDMAYDTTLVAFLPTAAAVATSTAGCSPATTPGGVLVRAFARDMAFLMAAIARLGFLGLSALARDVAFAVAVVADRISTRTILGGMSWLTILGSLW